MNSPVFDAENDCASSILKNGRDVDLWEWMRSVPIAIEPGAAHFSYRDAAEHFQRLNRQQLLLDLDSLIERHRDVLSVATFEVDVAEERNDIYWGKYELHLDASVDEDRAGETFNVAKRAVGDIIDLLYSYHSLDTEEMIAYLLYNFKGLHWTADVLQEVSQMFGYSLGLSEDVDTWLARHRAYRQAKLLEEATTPAITPSVRQRI